MISRREFLDRSGRFALGVAAMPLGGTGRELTLSNESIAATWTIADNAIRPSTLNDRLRGAALPVSAELFTLNAPSPIPASAFRIVGDPRVSPSEVSVTVRDPDRTLEVVWRATLRDDAKYLRQELSVRALKGAVALREISLFDFTAPGARVTGTVRGSPIVVNEESYFAFEHPLANNGVDGDRVRCRMTRTLPLRPGTTLEVSSVVGVTRTGQLRRDFLTYIERERAHPYRTFLHYNTWYDIGFQSQFSERDALAAVNAFGRELHEKRGVTLDSFLFDDGWDDPTTLWRFHPGFPNGFSRVRDAARKYGAAPGVWMSPWGGYNKQKEQRLAYGRAQGFETNERGFALSGPVYYKRFRDTCVEMIRKYGVNQFKLDGTGDAASTAPGSPFDSDFDAAIHLIRELRAEKPDLYVNLTVGTYPSPFWLRYADSIWRGGEDHGFAGVGTSRQRWITYRDADTYQRVVKAGALFPLNSVMLHGLIYARHVKELNRDPGGDFQSEVRSYFGTGTQLQEMYITPSLLSRENWDAIAESAKWSRANAETLVDTHWIGGDPSRLEPYGWASWSPKKGIVTLRNPGSRPQSIAIDVATALELPAGSPRQFEATNPWDRTVRRAFRAGEQTQIALRSFEVLTLELVGR
jgi:hypothetical protein